MHMKVQIYQITADDGNGETMSVELPRNELCKMVGESILQGVSASQEIEGEGGVEVILAKPINLPERILQTS